MKYVINYILNIILIIKYFLHNKKFFGKYKLKNKSNGIVLLECNNFKSNHIPYSYVSNICSKIYNAEIKSLNIKIIYLMRSFVLEHSLMDTSKIIP